VFEWGTVALSYNTTLRISQEELFRGLEETFFDLFRFPVYPDREPEENKKVLYLHYSVVENDTLMIDGTLE
jgi:hypothetical protein